nr:MAG TPA: NACHT domain protein [Caudoviricetes sp.]
MLAAVSLHHELVAVAALRLLGRRLVGLPPGCGKTALRSKELAYLLLRLGIGIVVAVAVGTVGLARLLVY